MMQSDFPSEPLDSVPICALPPSLSSWLDAGTPLPTDVIYVRRCESVGRWLLTILLSIPLIVWFLDWIVRVVAQRPWSAKEALVFGLMTGGIAFGGFLYYQRGKQKNARLKENRLRIGFLIGKEGILWCPEGLRVTWLPRLKIDEIQRTTAHHRGGPSYQFYFTTKETTLFELALGDVAWVPLHIRPGKRTDCADRLWDTLRSWQTTGLWSQPNVAIETLEPELSPTSNHDNSPADCIPACQSSPPPHEFQSSKMKKIKKKKRIDTLSYLCRCMTQRGARTRITHQPDGMAWVPVDQPITLSAKEMAPVLCQYTLDEIMIDGGRRNADGSIENVQRITFPDFIQFSYSPEAFDVQEEDDYR
jgi:hypothetical protein